MRLLCLKKPASFEVQPLQAAARRVTRPSRSCSPWASSASASSMTSMLTDANVRSKAERSDTVLKVKRKNTIFWWLRNQGNRLKRRLGPIHIKRLARFEHPVDQVYQLVHSRRNDGFRSHAQHRRQCLPLPAGTCLICAQSLRCTTFKTVFALRCSLAVYSSMVSGRQTRCCRTHQQTAPQVPATRAPSPSS